LPARKDFLRRIDQSAIYFKIAGTYTPFAVLSGSQAALFLTGIWGAALAGASLILFGPARLKRPSLLLYLAIGWAGIGLGQPFFAALSPSGFALILAGGCIYTLGVLFFLWERLPFHITIWHAFVLAATALLYAAVLIEILGRVPIA
jgi:hemolysin III